MLCAVLWWRHSIHFNSVASIKILSFYIFYFDDWLLPLNLFISYVVYVYIDIVTFPTVAAECLASACRLHQHAASRMTTTAEGMSGGVANNSETTRYYLQQMLSRDWSPAASVPTNLTHGIEKFTNCFMTNGTLNCPELYHSHPVYSDSVSHASF